MALTSDTENKLHSRFSCSKTECKAQCATWTTWQKWYTNSLQQSDYILPPLPLTTPITTQCNWSITAIVADICQERKSSKGWQLLLVRMFHLCSWVSSQSFFDQRTGNEQRNEKGATAVSSCKSFGPPWERPRSSQGFMAQAHTYTHTQTDRETRWFGASQKVQSYKTMEWFLSVWVLWLQLWFIVVIPWVEHPVCLWRWTSQVYLSFGSPPSSPTLRHLIENSQQAQSSLFQSRDHNPPRQTIRSLCDYFWQWPPTVGDLKGKHFVTAQSSLFWSICVADNTGSVKERKMEQFESFYFRNSTFSSEKDGGVV